MSRKKSKRQTVIDDRIPNVDIPDGKSGDWFVEKFEVNEKELWLFNLRCDIHGSSNRRMEPGTYTRLVRGGAVVMSDTPAEKRDHLEPVLEATGHVLVNGLGLGMVATACLLKDEVDKVTAVEISPDVIKLVAPTLQDRFGDRLEVVQADALKWKAPRGQRFNVVWHDIWSTICGDNLPAMSTLHRKYGRRCDWQGSWSRDEIGRWRWMS